ncbi:MAG: 16S rRNA (uracil(1498)-N(3))-methyltransferase [Candidatus Omnitrophica bacterium]|nr:16S rRNA (uracil(1498)-N(3))-methyltransferase [Candidatus Omnitrophota bacterium]
MNRFFVEKKYIVGTCVEITGATDVHHLGRVLRIPAGEDVLISDGDGGSYIAQVSRISKTAVSLKIKKELKRVRREEQKVLISLACAVPKNTHFEDIVDKCAQLGVDEIIPLITERTLVKKEAFDKKRGRLERIVISAAKQSGVLFLPELKEAQDFSSFLPRVGAYDLGLLPNLSQKPMSIKDALKNFIGRKVLIMIGPEGDFTPQEITQAIGANCRGISLGESVLRVDTAAVCAVSFLRLYLGL